ncbi:HAUS augmin-like complex subunit 8 isoform X1 [Anolis sagrei]|uniref:HAUS augmin-like complex subunit 8 isoform X1 n=1 Tax=Anolis sagrei TaxID=38937 RepID=UPI0035202BF7
MAAKLPSGGKGGVAEKEPGARPKERSERRGRVVPSRYMDYGKKVDGKSILESSLQAPKGQEKSLKKLTTQVPKGKASAALQSTLLDSHESVPPTLEVSAIKATEASKKQTPTKKKQPSNKKKQPLVETLIQIQDFQSLLLTFAAVQIEKNLALLEHEGEGKLAVLLEGRDRLQREAMHKGGLLAERQRRRQLSNALDAQLEALGSMEEQGNRFQQEYQAFATALDATRHALPVKEIYVPEDMGRYLADLETALLENKQLLAEALKEPSRTNANVRRPAQELQQAAQEVAQELPRAFSEVVELSADVSKEVSLVAQMAGEEAMGLEVAKLLYFG